jgi:hypothetical protein
MPLSTLWPIFSFIEFGDSHRYLQKRLEILEISGVVEAPRFPGDFP